MIFKHYSAFHAAFGIGAVRSTDIGRLEATTTYGTRCVVQYGDESSHWGCLRQYRNRYEIDASNESPAWTT
jgi:hypothetical protein